MDQSAPLMRSSTTSFRSSAKYRRRARDSEAPASSISESWELADTQEAVKVKSGELYVLRTGDAVGAVSWGRSKAKLLPCCLGGRQLGVTVLPAGFLHGRHLFVYEAPRKLQQHQEETRSSISLSGDGVAAAEAFTVVSFQFFHEGRRGCLEYNVEEDTLVAVLIASPTGTATATGNQEGEPSLRPSQWFHAIPVCSQRVAFKQGERETGLCLLRPEVKQSVFLKWKLNSGVRGALLEPDNTSFVFHLRKRAPHIVTDFVIEPSKFLTRVTNAFENRETDNRECFALERNPAIAEEPLRILNGAITPTVNASRQPVLHDFLTSERSRTVRAAAVLLQVVTSSTTIVIVLGVGYPGEPTAALGLRYALYSLIILSYVTIWIFYNQFYATCMFEFLLRRGHLMDVTPDVVRFKYLFVGGWAWYWIVVVAYLGMGGIYLHYFKEVALGTSWLFFTNSFIFFVGLVYKLRSPFDQQLMPLSTFVKSFDDGVISEEGLSRASAYLQQLKPVQACVSVANPPAYAFLGQLPTRQSCCWNWEGFAKRIAFVIIGSLLLGAGMTAAVILKQLLLGDDPFTAVNTCFATCVNLAAAVDVNLSVLNATQQAAFCGKCLCLCVSTMEAPAHLLSDCLSSLSTASVCTPLVTCPVTCPL